MTAHLILICHASTEAVRTATFPADEALDERGRQRAAGLAALMPKADAVWSSPEMRARQTAQALGLDAEPVAALAGCDYGTWTGRRFDDVLASEPDAVAQWLNDPASAPHGGESNLSLMARVAAWMDSESRPDRRSIAVVHASIVRAAVVHSLGAPPQSFWRIDVAPLSVTRLKGTNGRWTVASLGSAVGDRD